MIAEVIAVGSELTSGQKLDTNSQWLSQRLGGLGVEVRHHVSVDDNLERNIEVLRHACRRSQFVIVSGGLGSTQDDLTREALASLAGAPLVEDPSCLQAIEALFARRNRPMIPRNRVQALLPAGAEPLMNAIGTAPGIWMMLDGTHIVALPGVPNELMLMFEQQVAPRISRLTGRHAVIVHRVINLFGKGESEIEAQALDLTARDHRPEVGITASDATISFRITCEGPDEAAAFAASEPTAKQIYERFGDLIVGEGDAGVADALVAALLKTSSTIAVAESCTGGLIAAQLTKFAGVSEVFLGGVVSYSNAAKSEFLGVPASLIEQKGAVSPEVAEAMAVGARTRFGSTLALSVTGIAGPGGGTPEKPVGLVYLGLATPRTIYHKQLLIGSEQPRSVIRSRAAKHAMNFARLEVGRL